MSTLRACLWTALFSLLSAVNPVALKLGVAAIPPLYFGTIRLFLMIAVLLLILRASRESFFPAGVEARRYSWLAGLSKISNAAAIYLGLARTDAVRAVVLSDTYTVWVLLFAHWLVPGDRITPGKVGAVIFSAVGALIVMGENVFGGSGSLRGDILCLLSGVGGAAMAIYEKKAVTAGATPLQVTNVSVLANALAFTVLAAFFEDLPTAEMWTPWALVALFWVVLPSGVVQFYLRRWLLRFLPVTWFNPWAFFSRIITAILAVLFLKESLSLNLGAGFLLVSVGIYLTARERREEPAEELAG